HLFDRTFVNPSTKSIGCIIGFCLATDAHERNQPYWSPVRLGVVGSFNLASHNVLEASPNNDCTVINFDVWLGSYVLSSRGASFSLLWLTRSLLDLIQVD